jgi:microcystin-dependent protein
VELDGSSPVSYDAEPTLSSRESLATVGYVLDNVTGGAITTESQTTTGTAGETVAAGDLIYYKTSDQEWYLTDADTSATIEGVVVGVALGSGTDGVAITNGVLLQGIYTTSGLTAGSEYYASNTAGDYSTTPGTISFKVGIALSTTRLLKYPTNPSAVDAAIRPGFITLYGGSTPPSGYLDCDGTAVSRSTYTSLFNIVSTSYGVGDGATTFNVPDLRGAAIFGKGTRKIRVSFTSTDLSAGAGTVTRMETTGDYVTFSGGANLNTGDQVVFATTRGTLTANTIYYVINYSGTSKQIATSYANAIAGTEIGISYDNTSMTDTYYSPTVFSIVDPVPGDVITGNMVTLTTTGTLPANIPAGDYYMIRKSNSTFTLADSYAKAILGGGGLVNSSTAGTNVGSGSSVALLSGGTFAIGNTGGSAKHYLSVAELPSHTHLVPGSAGTGADGFSTGDNAQVASGSAGGDEAHENMPPYVIASYIIKY